MHFFRALVLSDDKHPKKTIGAVAPSGTSLDVLCHCWVSSCRTRVSYGGWVVTVCVTVSLSDSESEDHFDSETESAAVTRRTACCLQDSDDRPRHRCAPSFVWRTPPVTQSLWRALRSMYSIIGFSQPGNAVRLWWLGRLCGAWGYFWVTLLRTVFPSGFRWRSCAALSWGFRVNSWFFTDVILLIWYCWFDFLNWLHFLYYLYDMMISLILFCWFDW